MEKGGLVAWVDPFISSRAPPTKKRKKDDGCKRKEDGKKKRRRSDKHLRDGLLVNRRREWVIDYLRASYLDKGKRWYIVKWKGFGNAYNTAEPAEEILRNKANEILVKQLEARMEKGLVIPPE